MGQQDVRRVVVVGAGTMGHAIAQVFAQAEVEVGLVDTSAPSLQRALRLIGSNLKTLGDQGRVAPGEIPEILQRIRPTTDLDHAAKGTDFALEAVSEIPAVKEEVFKRLDEVCPEATILASNTSSLDIFNIVKVRRPGRLVVTHWFAPPHIIPLVEVVPGPLTSPEVLAWTAILMERLGKRPVILKQFMPGFIVNRIQLAVSGAVLEMLANGWATPEQIDLAVKTSLGIRLPVVGVAQSLDFTGLNLVYEIQRAAGQVSPMIQEKIEKGHLGASTSKGLYDYGGRSEEEILRKRDERYLQVLDHLEGIGAFEPV